MRDGNAFESNDDFIPLPSYEEVEAVYTDREGVHYSRRPLMDEGGNPLWVPIPEYDEDVYPDQEEYYRMVMRMYKGRGAIMDYKYV